MNTVPDPAPQRSDFPACKAIYCVLPDDGTDKRLMIELRGKKGILRAGSFPCRGIGALAEARTKRGKLPESDLVKQLCVICSDDQADEIFDLLFWSARLGKPGRGVMWQQPLTGATPYQLPADIPDETAGA